MRHVWMIDELFFFVFFLFSFTDSQNAFSELYVCHRLVDWGEGRLALYYRPYLGLGCYHAE